jgi:alpha-galactosidase
MVGSSSDSDIVELSSPSYYSPFVNGYLLDLADGDFGSYLSSHVSMLRERYSVDWWKYDQEFFARQSQAGSMKNVVAFQNALRTVRRENPDLVIENCQSGGRMINELTLLATQISWLQDGRKNGLEHARDNIETSLNALELIFPWAVYRWTNNLDRMDQADAELTRLYCRSAMAGTWGISSDLSAISDRQRATILKEIENYRRLNQIKQYYIYDLQQPEDGGDIARVTFYDWHRQSAGVMLYRWDREGAFDQRVTLKGLRQGSWYQVTDVDTGIKVEIKGKTLMDEGINVRFDSGRLSGLLFIEKIKSA